MIKNYSFHPATKGQIQHVKICKTCKHYRLDVGVSDQTLGRCQLYGVIELVSGNIVNDFAGVVRDDEAKCGFEAKFYEPK